MSDLLVKYTQEFLEKKEESRLRTILQRAFGITKGISKLEKQELIDSIIENRERALAEVSANKNVRPDLIYKKDGKEFKAKFQPETDEFDECIVLIDGDGEKAYEMLEDFNSEYKQMKYSEFTDKNYVAPKILDDDISDVPTVEEPEVDENMPEKTSESEEASESEEPVEKEKEHKTLKNVKAATNAYSKIYKETMQRFGYLTEEEDGFLEDLPEITKLSNSEFKSTYGFDDLESAKIELSKQDKPEQKQDRPSITTPKKGSKSSRVIQIVKDLEKKGEKYTSGTVMKKLKELHGEDIHRSFCITLMKRATS